MKNPNAIISSDFGPIVININDLIGRHIAATGYWALDDITLLNQIIGHLLKFKERLTIYDVGANIGTHTLAMAKLDPSRISVSAFEAQRQIFYMLCGTVAINGLRNVVCHHAAVSDSSDTLIEFQVPNYNEFVNIGSLELITPMRSDNATMKKSGKESVKTIRLDDLDGEVNLIKMDIEGMEAHALRGAERTIGQYRPVCFVEVKKSDYNFIFDFFKKLDYVGYQKNTGDLDLITFPRESRIRIGDAQEIF